MKIIHNLRDYENFHVTLWLLKDICWLTEFKIGGLIMAVPTIGVALHLCWLHRKNKGEFFHAVAVANWVLANAVWMIGEFYFDDTLRPIAGTFFGLGFVALAIYYLIILPRRLKE